MPGRATPRQPGMPHGRVARSRLPARMAQTGRPWAICTLSAYQRLQLWTFETAPSSRERPITASTDRLSGARTLRPGHHLFLDQNADLRVAVAMLTQDLPRMLAQPRRVRALR